MKAVHVDADDFGILVELFVKDSLGRHLDEDWTNAHLRAWWPHVEGWYRRQIVADIEVELHLDHRPRAGRRPLPHKEMWKALVRDLRDPPSEFTVDYRCGKCKIQGVKLWRGVHGCADRDGHELLCATCLAPGERVTDDGRLREEDGSLTDQVKGWLPACPTDGTFWGYSSVPSQDVERWTAWPTYSKERRGP